MWFFGKKIEIDLLIWKGAWLKIWWWPLICDYKVDWILFKHNFYALTTNMLPSLAPKIVSLSTLNEQGIELYIWIIKFLLPCELAYLGILMNQSSRLVSHLGPVKIVGASMSYGHIFSLFSFSIYLKIKFVCILGVKFFF